jgi:hypothetical protein
MMQNQQRLSNSATGVTRPRIDYAALDRVIDLEDDQEVADHPPEHVLETLRDWMNLE